jgi:ABC-type uncharacterized transport system involved in gliding motility auxiliary subunit
MRPARRAAAGLAALIVVVVAANMFVGGLARSWDVTGEQSATLSEQTRSVLLHVHKRIEITAFFPRDAVGRVEAATLLSRFHKRNRLISFRIVDPSLVPGEAQRLGVSEIGSAAVQQVEGGQKTETAQYTIEIDLTSAIARLLRNAAGTICFTTGHGEHTVDEEGQSGLSQAGRLLLANGYTVDDVDLLAHPAVTAKCTALVIAAPASALDPAAVRAVRAYLTGAGKAFVIADPRSSADLTPVTSAWGISFDHGTVVEGDPNSHLPDDLTAPIVHAFSASSPPVRGLGPAFFPGVEAVDAKQTQDPGLATAPVAFTTPLSYLDRRDMGKFDEKVDRRGPIPIGATADYSEVSRPTTRAARIVRTRVIAWGDVDFATNAFVTDAANAKLFIQAIDWLAQPEELVTAVPNFPKIRNLALTQARSHYILALMAGIVPGLFLVAGGMVWVLRRGR